LPVKIKIINSVMNKYLNSSKTSHCALSTW